jgi:ABC-2 type transport system ATP-binding protein
MHPALTTSDDEPLLRVDRVTKSYGDTAAVRDLTLHVRRGEALGLLGPNGAGKSTLMQLIAGILAPDTGRITVGAARDPHLPHSREAIGFVPQALAVYPKLTVAENLRFFGRLHGLRGDLLERRVRAGLELADLVARSGTRAHALSVGMQRRLNLACAVLHAPALLLLDEPTVGIDPQARNHIFETIEQLKAEGTTLLYSTHLMEEAARLCDRIAIVDRGQILSIGTVAGLVAAHGGLSSVEIEVDPESATTPDRLQLQTEHPFETVAQLVSSGVRMRSLQIRKPNLESVFLCLTGKALRE